MNTQDVMVLEWTFSPPDYFEEPVSISRDDYQITIRDGKVEARMESVVYESIPALKDTIENALNQRFRAVELLTQRAYALSYARRLRLHPDGHKEFFITASDSIALRDSVDIRATDRNGNVVYDSRKERIKRQTELADLAEKHGSRDPLARSILASYHAAVEDPDNELVHLYEIRDALAKEFGGEKQACNELGIGRGIRSELGRLADNEPIKQGRHRGKFAGKLRDATESELERGREIARNLVTAYLRFLERNVH